MLHFKAMWIYSYRGCIFFAVSICSDIIKCCAIFALRMLIYTVIAARHGVLPQESQFTVFGFYPGTGVPSHRNGPTIDNMCGQEQPRLLEWATGTGQRSIICVVRNNHACKNGPGTTRLVKMIQERAKNGPRTGQEQPKYRPGPVCMKDFAVSVILVWPLYNLFLLCTYMCMCYLCWNVSRVRHNKWPSDIDSQLDLLPKTKWVMAM